MCKQIVLATILLLSLGSAQARDIVWMKAAYWDARYPTSWVSAANAPALRDGLRAAGYTILNADDLRTWMNARSAETALSVVVMCHDVAPDTVIEVESASCTLRQYLDTGGKIVWFGDIPFYNQGHADGTRTTWGNVGAPAILGFDTSTAPRDSGNTASITALGKAWGLTTPWTTQRPAAPNVTTFDILATDNAGNAAAWVKHYVPGDTICGFVRLRDTSGLPVLSDIIAVAKHATKAGSPQPVNGATGVTLPVMTWSVDPSARWDDVYFGTSPSLGAAEHVVHQTSAMAVYYYAAGVTPGTTYYWRIDETAADGTVYTGDIWSFTAFPATAWTPSPSDGASYVAPNVTLAWTGGRDAVTHDVYLGTDRAAVQSGAAAVKLMAPLATTSHTPPALERGRTYYWRVDENTISGAVPGPVWSFTTRPLIAKADPNLVGWWKMDDEKCGLAVDSSGYDNYGTLVNGPKFVEGVFGEALSFDGADDYVNCGNDASLIRVGSVSVAAWIRMGAVSRDQKIASNQNGSTGGYKLGVYGGNNMAEFEIRSATNVAILNRTAPGGTVLQANTWYHVAGVYNKGRSLRTYINGKLDRELVTADAAGLSTGPLLLGRESYSSAYYWLGLMDDVRIYTKALTDAEIRKILPGDPLIASAPQPTTGSSIDLRDATSLTWSAGGTAVRHDVYFGKDKNAVRAADTTSSLYQGRQSGTSFSLAGLVDLGGGAYYWRIDEVEADSQALHKGYVWSFTILGYLFVDDFESYNDTNHCIFDTWIDGYTSKQSGSTVGHLNPPFAEQAMIHGGKQSMPMDYNNLKTPFFSEAVQTFPSPQDWTGYGVTDLSLWFRGYPVGFAENGNNAYTLSGSGTDIGSNADACRFAYKRLSGDGSLTARIDSQTNTDLWAKAGAMIRETLEAGATHAAVVVTPANGVSFLSRPVTADTSVQTNSAGLAAPCWVRLTRTGNTFKAECSADGKTWAQVGTSTTILMRTNVYLGLAVTAHNAAMISTAEFSHVSISGGVSGLWQARGIGAGPQPGNDPDTLYLAVEDSTGKVVMVTHPDPAATLTPAWTKWKIPLDSLTGVDRAHVKKLYLGVGDRKAPVVNGAGRIFIDDIQVIK